MSSEGMKSTHQGSSHEAGLESRDHAVILLVEKLAQRVESTRLWVSQQHHRDTEDSDVPLLSQKENSFQPEFFTQPNPSVCFYSQQ